MQERTLISAPRAHELLAAGAARAFDCRWQLTDKAFGEAAYRAGHLPGALFANLDTDLADLSQQGLGRHPLPGAAQFSATLSRWGLTPDTAVIAYDEGQSGYASRLWWLLRMAGHEQVAVLDGGLQAWQALGLPLTTDVPVPAPTQYPVRFDTARVHQAPDVAQALAEKSCLLVDVRGPARFRGDEEPIDPVAGHVPGAVNRPFALNLGPDGRFKPAPVLREEFAALLGARAPSDVVHMCGSGVTACQSLLAMEHAGLPGSRLFAGAWSGWISDRARPVATGP